MSRRCLPVSIPIVTSYPWHACHLSILSTLDNAHPWIYTHFVQIYCHTGFDINTQGGFDFFHFDFEYCIIVPWFRKSTQKFQKRTLDQLLASSKKKISDFIKESIESGYYVTFLLDDYYNNQTRNYNKYHINHEVLIYGYDDDEQVFNTAGFFRDSIFQFSKHSYFEINSIYNMTENDLHPVLLIQLDTDLKYEVSPEEIRDILADFLYSVNTSKRYILYNMNPSSDEVYGISTYQYLLESNSRMLINQSKSRIDIRAYHILYEHKYTLNTLCIYLNEKLFLEIDHLVQVSNTLVKESIIMRNLCLKYNMTFDLAIIERLNKLLDRIKCREEVLIEDLLKELNKSFNLEGIK